MHSCNSHWISDTITNKTLTSPTIFNPSITGDISGTGNLILTSTDAGSSAAPEFELYRNSASPADADYLGQVKFTGESDDGSKRSLQKLQVKSMMRVRNRRWSY